MNLVIDIGNTRAKAGYYRKGSLIASAVLEDFTPQTASAWIEKYPVKRCIISSVRQNEEPLTAMLKEKVSFFIHLSHTTPLPFRNLYRTPESLGKDRIAAVAGALRHYPGSNLLVIDTGTAITYDLITCEADYIGGNISPGLITRFRALHDYTSRLPLLEKDDCLSGLGTDTRSAIIAGVQSGILYEISGYIDFYSKQYADLMIILTGGDADFFVNKLKKTIFVIPNLVLDGLDFILNYNAQQV
jgi:type III pantothenate kinase